MAEERMQDTIRVGAAKLCHVAGGRIRWRPPCAAVSALHYHGRQIPEGQKLLSCTTDASETVDASRLPGSRLHRRKSNIVFTTSSFKFTCQDHAMAKNLRLYIKSFTPITCTKLAQPDGCPGSDALHVAQQQAAARQVTGVGQCK